MGFVRIAYLLTGLAISQVHAAPLNIPLALQDHVYTLNLEDHLLPGITTIPNDSIHYKGKIAGVESSWARLSNIANKWEGVVFLNGELFIVNMTLPATHARSIQTTVMSGTAASEFDQIGTCNLHAKENATNSENSSRSLKMSAPTVQAASFDSLCSSTVDGLCLLSEIDFVFDQSFQALFPSNYEQSAAQYINIVEGYYENELNMAFKTLTTTFLDSQVFTSSTDSLTVLEDVSAKKRDGELSFSTKNQALIQLVTGRDFDGDTVGVAWLEGLCDSSGYWSTSTVQIVNNNIALSALIAAHEIGHNLGAAHDGSGNACGSGFIMAPILNPSASEFSDCTDSYINDAISDITNQDTCFDYPFDIEITDTNSSDSLTSSSATRTFTINAAVASRAITQATLTGSITSGTGSFSAVTIDGINCTLSNENQNYQCTLLSPSSNHTLSTSLSVVDGSYTVTHDVAVSQAELEETDSSNNQMIDNFSVDTSLEGEEPAPEEPGANATTEESAESESESESESNSQNNESSKSETSSTSSGGSSGGGSVSFTALVFLVLCIVRRKLILTTK